MKELSIEEKAKAKAYDKIRKKIAIRFGSNVADEIFSEYEESEDERIRRWIINEIKIKHHNLDEDNVDFVDKAIAWLEKQGEQKSINDLTPQEAMDIAVAKCFEESEQKSADKVEPKFKIGDIIRLKDGDGLEWTVEKVLNNGYYTIFCADRDDFIQLDDKWELVEQKPAWSEEDESYLNTTIAYLKDAKEFKKTAENCINWLKSLKDRYTWKPSDEQIIAVNTAINVLGKGTLNGKQLIELQEQLKKLRDE